MNTALITGASSGFGEAIALHLASMNYRVIITGRRADRLKAVADTIQKKYNVDVLQLVFDVRDRKQVHGAIQSLKGDWKNVDVLVNNAGGAHGLEPIQEGNPDDWDTMLDTNVKGLLYVTKEVMPLMIARSRGHIINIGSTAGKEVYAKGNVYCAAKFAVDALSKGMRIDLLPHNIKVTGINPGAAETEFSVVRFKGDQEKAKNVYKGFQPLTAQDIAEIVGFVVSRPAHVNIFDIVVTPTAQANTVHIKRSEKQADNKL